MIFAPTASPQTFTVVRHMSTMRSTPMITPMASRGSCLVGSPRLVFTALMAFLAFSFCASSIYVLNDLVDLPADRVHRTKRNRPIAAGALSIPESIVLSVGSLALSMALAVMFEKRINEQPTAHAPNDMQKLKQLWRSKHDPFFCCSLPSTRHELPEHCENHA